MTVAIELFSEADIKKKLKKFSKIAIVACPICINTCLAAISQTGILEEFDNISGKFIPRAITDKTLELKNCLSKEGNTRVCSMRVL